MRFLVDAQLPPALARELARAGHQADHVIDIGPPDATDEELWLWAAQHAAVIITKDEDFASMVLLAGAGSPAVVWVRTGNVRRATCSSGSCPWSTRSSRWSTRVSGSSSSGE